MLIWLAATAAAATLLPDLKLKIICVLAGITKPFDVVTLGARPNCTECATLPVVIKILRPVITELTVAVVVVCNV